MVWMTPRAAELTMWLTGLVTLMLMKPAMQMRKPKTPWAERAADRRHEGQPIARLSSGGSKQATHRHSRSPEEAPEKLNVGPRPQDLGALGADDRDGQHDDGREGVRVPGEGHRRAVDRLERVLDDDGVAGRRERAQDAKHNAEANEISKLA
jgi:hypothetical protein